ncbi:MAG: PHP domain-containing protein [Candidatus Bathyarchaeia archaeon]
MISREVLKIHTNGEFLLGDLHTHSVYSDGVNTPSQIVRKAKVRGLDVVAITDHAMFGVPSRPGDSAGSGLYPAHFPACREAALRYGVAVVPGIEVYSNEGHILALFASYGVSNEILRIRNGLSARETVEYIHDAGGVAVAAHVHRRDGLRERLIGVADVIDGVELCGSLGGLFDPALADELGVAELAGSDAHSRMSVGLAFTLFPRGECGSVEGSSVLEDLLGCVRRRRTRGHVVPFGGLIRCVDKARWLNPFYASKSLAQLLDDRYGVLGRKMEALLVDP